VAGGGLSRIEMQGWHTKKLFPNFELPLTPSGGVMPLDQWARIAGIRHGRKEGGGDHNTQNKAVYG